MKLIVGLGNPEARYDGTRHNVGFLMIDHLAKGLGGTFQPKTKFKADIAETTIDNHKILLVKPTTYYNLSGDSLRALIDFYKIDPVNCLIIHDELALVLGTVRTRLGGSDAGNNGVKSINEQIGEGTHRLRIGIATELRDQVDDSDYVLGKFNSDEREIIDNAKHIVMGCVDDFIYDQLTPTTHK